MIIARPPAPESASARTPAPPRVTAAVALPMMRPLVAHPRSRSRSPWRHCHRLDLHRARARRLRLGRASMVIGRGLRKEVINASTFGSVRGAGVGLVYGIPIDLEVWPSLRCTAKVGVESRAGEGPHAAGRGVGGDSGTRGEYNRARRPNWVHHTATDCRLNVFSLLGVATGLTCCQIGHMLRMVIEPDATQRGRIGEIWICSCQHRRSGLDGPA